ncbi:hypothetical protein INT46_003659 [Mucor plumbeus]|uniref:HNH domain-containing protein n=1 Tax=Mucor plumbeus TaxID=97098 RepID=A0A8H7RCY2_9FUNG|nr:hypothetical protein INT46_003659 [Mucor plumbeus]
MPREKKEVTMPSKKSNIIYENWRVYSKHHKLMFRCNEKKARWYLEKELATVMPKEERAIKLNFEAKGDGHKHGDYMVEDRSNICVSCGGNEYLTMHHVVPEMYRHWMPLVVKSKSSRDLLLLCKHCHDDYEQKAMIFKKAGVKRFNIPLEGSGWCTFPEYKNAKKAASALIRSSDKIPKERQEILKTTVLDFWKDYDKKKYKGDNLNDILKECTELVDHFKGPDYIEHGQSAINQLTSKCVLNDKGQETWPDLDNFIREWRQHFLDNLQPKHLSKLWSVDADIYTR